MSNEEILTAYMQKWYSDEKLAALLEHAESGKLSFDSCCCFIGVATADHPLQGAGVYYIGDGGPDHFDIAEQLSGASEAEDAFLALSDKSEDLDEISPVADAERRAKLIPLIHQEMKRRSSESVESQAVEVCRV